MTVRGKMPKRIARKSVVPTYFANGCKLHKYLGRGVLPENLRRGRTLWSMSKARLASNSAQMFENWLPHFLLLFWTLSK